MSATDVYGKANTAVFMTDSSATYFDDATPYISMTGENCMFGSTYMTARVYLVRLLDHLSPPRPLELHFTSLRVTLCAAPCYSTVSPRRL